jgi:hypothetical protein
MDAAFFRLGCSVLLGCALFSIPNFINHVNWIAQCFVCRVALLVQQFD